MSSGQVKRKANPAVADGTNVNNKKQRQNQSNNNSDSFTPQLLDFDNVDEALLPRSGDGQALLFTEEDKKISKKLTKQQRNANNTDDLFSSKKNALGGDGEDVDSDDDEDKFEDKIEKDLKKSKHDHSASQLKKTVVPLDGIQIKKPHHLTSKTIQIGEIFMATVANITPFELKVTLPDGLSGSISYREISDTLTAQIDKALETHMDDPNQINVSTLRNLDVFEEVPSLEELFTIGQQITPMVIKVINKPHSKTMKQKIFCSLRPSIVNAQYSQSLSLLPSCGTPLLGDIESVEAKGFVINYGLSFKGFVPFTDKTTSESYPTGALVTTLLPKDRKITSDDRTVQVSLDSNKILHQAISTTADVSFEQIRPGQFYHGMVSKHLSDGSIVVQILGAFYVTISTLHLPPSSTASSYPLLDNVIIRILSSQATKEGEQKITGTLHIDLVSPKSLYGNNVNFTTVAQLGDIKQVKVVKMIGDKALLVKFLHDSTGTLIPDEFYSFNKSTATVTPPSIYGWLALRSCADVPLTDFPKQFKVGSVITTRVIGFNYLDGVIQLSTKPSLLQAQAMSYDDMVPGEQYHGIVIKTLPNKIKKGQDDKKSKDEAKKTIKNGVILQISPSVTAFIPLSQLTNQGAPSNTALITKKYSLGSKHTCRVLVCEPSAKKLIVTTKPALMEKYGQDEVFSDYEHAKKIFSMYQKQSKPLLLGGYIDRCSDEFIVVRFFNNIAGVITKKMLVQQGVITETQKPEFSIGEFIQTRVLNVYDDKLSLSLAINLSQEEQAKIVKLSTAEKTKTQSKKSVFDEVIHAGAVIPNIRITGSQITPVSALQVEYSIADVVYKGIINASQLTDIVQNQPLFFKKLGTPASGSGNYHTLPYAVVLGVNTNDKGEKIVEFTLKLSAFIMNSTTTPITTSDINTIFNPANNKKSSAKDTKKAIDLAAFDAILTKLVTKTTISSPLSSNNTTVTALNIPQYPNPYNSTGPYIATIVEFVDKDTIKAKVSNSFSVYIHRSKLLDGVPRELADTLQLDEIYTVGQSIIVSRSNVSTKNEKEVIQYQSRIVPLIITPAGLAYVSKWSSYLETLFKFESQLFGIGNVAQNFVQFPTGFELGNQLKNAKIANLDQNSVTFTTPTSIKNKIIIKCINVDYHAPNITDNYTIGSALDITVIGYDASSKTVHVSTLDSYKPSTTKPSQSTAHTATVVDINDDTMTVSIDSQLSLATSTLQINIGSFTPYTTSGAIKVGSVVNAIAFGNDNNIAIVPGTVATKLVKKTSQPTTTFAPNTLYDASITTSDDIIIGADLKCKVIGLVKDGDDTIIPTSKYTTIVDLRRHNIKVELGPKSATLDKLIGTISLSSVIDASVPDVATAKKTKKTAAVIANVLTSLTAIVNDKKSNLITTKVIGTNYNKSNKVTTVQLTIRPSELTSNDYISRCKNATYQSTTVHNAVIMKLSDVTGIMAQINPNLQVLIPVSAAVVVPHPTKPNKFKTGDFAQVTSTFNLGDVITFRVLSQSVEDNATLIDGALIHPTLNATGIDANAKATKSTTTTATPSQSTTTTTVSKPVAPRATKITGDIAVGNVFDKVKVTGFNTKSNTYMISLPNNQLGEINFAELVDGHDIITAGKLESFKPAEMYKVGDIIPQVIVISSRKATTDSNPVFICSARVSRRFAMLNGTIVDKNASGSIVAELVDFATAHNSKITPASTIASSTMSDDSDKIELPIIDGLVVDTLSASTISPQQLVLAYVSAVNKSGVFVQFNALYQGLITYSELTDTYQDAKSIAKSGLYNVGQPILVRVKNVTETDSGDIQINLTAKQSATNLTNQRLLTSLTPGSVISGVVKQVTQFGVFVLIKPSMQLTGLVHKSQCVDDRTVDYQTYYKPGDNVKAVVLKVDIAEKKIDLGLKASLFTKLDKIKQDAKNNVTSIYTTAVESSDDEDSDDDSTVSGPKIGGDIKKQQKQLNISASKEQDVLSSLFSTLPPTTTAKATKTTKKTAKQAADEDDELIDFSILDSKSAIPTASTTSRLGAGTTTKASSERQIELLEHALVGLGDHSVLSTMSDLTHSNYTIDQYEIQCVAQPNNAAVWVSYMAHQLENNEIQLARDICHKALKVITISSLDQRWIMYSSLLSIEVLYGTVTSLETAIKLALKEFEKNKVYSEIGRIAISAQKYPLAIDYYTKALSSSGLAQDIASNQTKPRQLLTGAQETYISLISLLFAQQKRTEAQSLLKQAINQLPQAFTGLIIIKTILLEFQSTHGSIENGRVMFQMFLKDHPKRVDVWTTWFQQEIKLCKTMHQALSKNGAATQAKKNEFKQQKTRIRELFDIFTTKSNNDYGITWTTLKPAQMKLIYSLAIDFENSPICLGDSRTDMIKDRAQIYVEEVSN